MNIYLNPSYNAIAIIIYIATQNYAGIANRSEPHLSMPISKVKKIGLVVCKIFGPEIA